VSPLRRSPRQNGQAAAAAAAAVTTQAQGYTAHTLRQAHYLAFHSTGVIGKPCHICKRLSGEFLQHLKSNSYRHDNTHHQ
jgi:hypothetical protein